MSDEEQPKSSADNAVDAFVARLASAFPAIPAKNRTLNHARLKACLSSIKEAYRKYFAALDSYQHMLTVDMHMAEEVRKKAHEIVDLQLDLLNELEGFKRTIHGEREN